MKKIRLLINILCLTAVIGIFTVCGLFYYHSKNLPNIKELADYDPPIVTRFYAANGKLLEEYAKEHRLYISINAIPDKVKNAFIAVEDKNFYENPGVDLVRLAKAVFVNIINIGRKRAIGGSTITQQVVKNFFLTSERSFARKIKEAILSFRITKAYSKDRILELYLNQIFLGSRSYGVASAALNYFNKSLEELNIEEIAFLAALPKAPSSYNPKSNYNKAKERRDWVIERMLKEGYIKEHEAIKAKLAPIILIRRSPVEIVKADYFAESVRQEISEKYGKDALYEGGLVVKTTLNEELQEYAEEAFKKGILDYDQKYGYRGVLGNLGTDYLWHDKLVEAKYDLPFSEWKKAVILKIEQSHMLVGLETGETITIDEKNYRWSYKRGSSIFKKYDIIIVEDVKGQYFLRQIPEVSGAIVVMNPDTGQVLAMVGGVNFNKSKFNRATQAYRQAGSSFKPFVFLAALENGYKPNDIIVDEEIEIFQAPHLPLWKPRNFERNFLGPMTLRKGLEKSRNIITVKISQDIGMDKVVEITKRFDLNDNPPSNPASVLGSTETTLLNLTKAYAMIANGGKKIYASLIEKVQDKRGKILYKHDKRACKNCLLDESDNIEIPSLNDEREVITDARTAYQMISFLEGAVKRGTAGRAKALKSYVAGKTGTTNNSMDGFFIGFTNNLVVGVYVGYDAPRSLGKFESGATTALPIFVNFMENALKIYPSSPFNAPPGMTFKKINIETGELTEDEISNKVILEAFKTGTEPVKNTLVKEDDKTEDQLTDHEEIEELTEIKTGSDGIY